MSLKPQNQLLSEISTTTKLLLIVGCAFLSYGYLCSAAKIYFFWESGIIAWYLLLLGAISFFLNRIDTKSSRKQPTVIEKAATFGLVFILAIKLIVFGAFVFSDAFETASNYLKTNDRIRSEIGPVKGVILFSEGEINTATNLKGEQGEGVLNLVVKGSNKYKHYEMHLVKKYEENAWQVVEASPKN
ncbi:Coa1/Tim21 domain-containing protein [Hymenobacter terricola]|uniref:cytochrome c oxidase assembly factor Coa1 family protein n=1 Tax=Hymenobacter terricola TaxID=2819236 RepID=UPI001B30B942|nr:cytochrome c oxidase assembly factor Coa1 family protein [Hymenobacter terricola]